MAKGTVRKAARKALLVGNPAAQSGRNEERIGEARSLLDHAAIAHDFLPTEPNGATRYDELCAEGTGLALDPGRLVMDELLGE